MELTDALKMVFIETAQSLRGAKRRLFTARTVKMLGRGGAQRAEGELGWNRVTIRKGLHELEGGFTCIDNLSALGRKRAEELQQLLDVVVAETCQPVCVFHDDHADAGICEQLQ